jgi:hypothetical protein
MTQIGQPEEVFEAPAPVEVPTQEPVPEEVEVESPA